LVQAVKIHADRSPTCVEIRRLVLGCDEAPVEPDAAAAHRGKDLESFGKTIEEPASMLVPPKPFQDFVPGRQVLAYRQATCVVELRDHSTTLSLWSVPPGDNQRPQRDGPDLGL
jgi:hypothetical protein